MDLCHVDLDTSARRGKISRAGKKKKLTGFLYKWKMEGLRYCCLFFNISSAGGPVYGGGVQSNGGIFGTITSSECARLEKFRHFACKSFDETALANNLCILILTISSLSLRLRCFIFNLFFLSLDFELGDWREKAQ